MPHVGTHGIRHRAATDIANLRQNTISRRVSDGVDVAVAVVEGEAIPASKAVYRPFRHRKDQTRAVPPGTKRVLSSSKASTV